MVMKMRPNMRPQRNSRGALARAAALPIAFATILSIPSHSAAPTLSDGKSLVPPATGDPAHPASPAPRSDSREEEWRRAHEALAARAAQHVHDHDHLQDAYNHTDRAPTHPLVFLGGSIVAEFGGGVGSHADADTAFNRRSAFEDGFRWLQERESGGGMAAGGEGGGVQASDGDESASHPHGISPANFPLLPLGIAGDGTQEVLWRIRPVRSVASDGNSTSISSGSELPLHGFHPAKVFVGPLELPPGKTDPGADAPALARGLITVAEEAGRRIWVSNDSPETEIVIVGMWDAAAGEAKNATRRRATVAEVNGLVGEWVAHRDRERAPAAKDERPDTFMFGGMHFPRGHPFLDDHYQDGVPINGGVPGVDRPHEHTTAAHLQLEQHLEDRGLVDRGVEPHFERIRFVDCSGELGGAGVSARSDESGASGGGGDAVGGAPEISRWAGCVRRELEAAWQADVAAAKAAWEAEEAVRKAEEAKVLQKQRLTAMLNSHFEM